MRLMTTKTAEFLELCSIFPLAPIENDDSYQAALEILDRLFALDDRRTQDQLDYFRALAQITSEYEMTSQARNSPP
jgi:antitoxin component HigA of HigAB toxin-antitoxin module